MWHVLQVAAGKEQAVAEALAALTEFNIKACAPSENRLIRKGGGWEAKLYTLFPGYVFAQLKYTAESYYAIKKLPGVLRFLGADGLHPEHLTYIEAEWLRALANEGEPLEPTRAALNADGEIILQGGILKSFASRIVKLDKHSRKASVELSVCGEKKIITLSFVLEGEESEPNEQ